MLCYGKSHACNCHNRPAEGTFETTYQPIYQGAECTVCMIARRSVIQPVGPWIGNCPM